MIANFDRCEICGADVWNIVYEGPVRDGPFGRLTGPTVVAHCGECGVERLAEKACLPDSAYETSEYRAKLAAGLTSAEYWTTHDAMQRPFLDIILGQSPRGKTVADVGCGGGGLLDHLCGLASERLAIEPYREYRADLARRGYRTYAYARDALGEWAGKIDLATSIQVIEHTADPRAYLADIAELLAPEGRLVISTPNTTDLLLELLGAEYRQFYYRTVHRWYFSAASLTACARLAGLELVKTRHLQRYGLSNAMGWLRDRRPLGASTLAGIDTRADAFWKSHLEEIGRSECLLQIYRASR